MGIKSILSAEAISKIASGINNVVRCSPDKNQIKDHELKGIIDAFVHNIKRQNMPPKRCLSRELYKFLDKKIENFDSFEPAVSRYLSDNLEKLIISPEFGLVKEKHQSNYFETISYELDEIMLYRLTWEEVEDIGIDTNVLFKGRKYQFGSKAKENPIDPRRIRQECIKDYLDYCESKVDSNKTKELKKIEFARKVFGNDESLIVYDYLGSLYKNTRSMLKNEIGSRLEKGRKLKQITRYKATRKLLECAALEEMETLMRNKETDEKRNSLEFVLRKYKPEVYEEEIKVKEDGFLKKVSEPLYKYIPAFYELLKYGWNFYKPFKLLKGAGGIITCFLASPFLLSYNLYYTVIGKEQPDYEIEVTRNPKKVKMAAQATIGNCYDGSCIADKDLREFERYTSDSGTIFLIGKQNGKLSGYSRIFITKNEKREPVLFIDTIEPPRKNFDDYKGLINAFSLGAIQLGFDIGAKYVVGNDSRIKYGPKQAFGKTERKMILEKLGGKGVWTNDFMFIESGYEVSPYILMENWRK